MLNKPITLETERFLIHGFRAEEMNRLSELSAEVFRILSDDHTLRYLPAKRLDNVAEAEVFLQGMLLNFHSGRNFLHFITDKLSGKVVGMIDLISPALAKEHYQIPCYPFFIEFYLGSFATGCQLMSEVLPAMVAEFVELGIDCIGAVVDRGNIPAKKVLKKAQFSRRYSFDDAQDFYELSVVLAKSQYQFSA